MLRKLSGISPLSRAINLRGALAPVPSMGTKRHFMNQDDSPLDGIRYFFQRQKLLLKAAMVKRKSFIFRQPGFISREREPVCFNYNWSDLCGHGSFMFLALSYLESDFLNLRLYAMSGVTLSILFQYYREKPLWIPIRWNTIFFLINAVMVGYLIKDDMAAQTMSPEQKALYRDVFERKGMARGDFVRLMAKAKREVVPKGVKIIDETKRNTRVYMLHQGRVSIRKKGSEVGQIGENGIVGEMSFITWDAKQEADKYEQAAAASSLSTLFASNESMPSTHATVHSNGAVPSNAAVPSATTSFPVTAAGTPSPDEQDPWLLKRTADLVGSWWGLVYSFTVGPPSPAGVRAPSTEVSPPLDPVMLEDGHMAHADAVCLTDCVMYYWRFKDLRQIKAQSPNIWLIMERCISEDLNKKMTSSWDKEIRERYKQLLLGATSQGSISDTVKSMLSRCRQRFHISELDHESYVREVGWSLEEFATGFKGAFSLEVLQTYEKMIHAEIDLPCGITDAGRTRLRAFRQEHNLSSAVHINALKNLGWSLDDYEAGQRTTAKPRIAVTRALAVEEEEPWKPSRPVLRFVYETFIRTKSGEFSEERPNQPSSLGHSLPSLSPSAIRSIEDVINLEPEL